MMAQFDPLHWLINELVPDEGLTLLGGKKKLGKSWLCLQIAQAIALGEKTLDKDAKKGSVVYLCLEDGERRLRDRLDKQKAKIDLPITYYTRFPPLDKEGLLELIGIAKEKPRLVIIDTLAAAKTGRIEENAAGPMADLINSLRRLAQHYKLGILLTHHHGKLVGGNPGDDLRGSSAVAAAADVNLGIYKEGDGFRLRGEGRDVEAFDLAITFDAHKSWKWLMLGSVPHMEAREMEHAVLMALRSLGETDAKAVAAFIGKSEDTAERKLKELLNTGRVVCRPDDTTKRGRPRLLYRVAASEDRDPFPDGLPE